MRRFTRTIYLTLGGLVAGASSATQVTAQAGSFSSTADVAAAATPAAVTILALDASGDTISQGSGFLIREDGTVVTNFHVLRGASSAVVILPSKERFSRNRVLEADSLLDLAILRVPGAGMPFLRTRVDVPRPGERAIAIGSPLGLENTVSEGIVSAVRVLDGRELVQITASISPGSSGGAVLDKDGRVFAISTLYLKGGQSLNFAVPIKYALGLLRDARSSRTVAETFGSLSAGDGNSASSDETELTSRTSSPRSDISGTYSIAQMWRDSKTKRETSREIGLLFAGEHVGLFVLARADKDWDKDGRTRIYPVRRWATNSAGDVVLSAGGVNYDGYQTADAGFWIHGELTLDNGEERLLSAGGSPQRIPLSSNHGLFTVSGRTFYRSNRGDDSDTPTDWTGELAVAFASDSIAVFMYIENRIGGNTSFYAEGPLSSGTSFSLTSTDGSRLTGRINAGVLTAEWLDRREKGSFIGRIRADRR